MPNMMKKIFFVATIFFACNVLAQKSKNLMKMASSSITAEDLKTKLSIIAGADMEGRETATEGQRKAAAYIENYFKQIGLQPGTPQGYQVYFPVYRDSLTSTSLKVGDKSFVKGIDFSVSSFALISGSWKTDSIVFAGYGIVDSMNNDFKKVNAKDKWVLILDGVPPGMSIPADISPFKDPSTIFSKINQAKIAGAKGIVFISKNYPKKADAPVQGNMFLKKPTATGIPIIYASVEVANNMLNSSAANVAELLNNNPGAYATDINFSSTATTNNLQSSDVIGVLPGSDKKDEYVLVTGHYDHLGKRDSVIYYGADDDGSGTTSVLEIAKAFVEAKAKGYTPRRTMVFMTVSGEEKGLWGSEYYTSHPVFPLEKTSVDLNIDMVGRIDPDRKQTDSTNYVYTIGEDKLSTDLMKISDSINNQYSHLDLDRKYNDPKDPNRFYYRSDHYNFAKHGVPVIFYFNGTHADYHRPTDTVDKINFDVMEKRVRLVFYTAWAMANRENMLVRDIPLK